MEVMASTEKMGSLDNLKKRPSSSPEKADDMDSNVNSAKLCLSNGSLEQETVMNSKRLRTIPNSPSVAEDAGSHSPAIPEKLEVPSKELQCIQKQVLIEKLMSTTTAPVEVVEPMDVQSEAQKKPIKTKKQSKKQFRLPPEPASKSLEDFRKTFKMRSSILDRVKVFLPELKNANEELLRLPDPSKLSLESDTDEMDGAVAGPSGLSSHNSKEKAASNDAESKTYVEMNLALVEQSDSDSSSGDESQDNRSIFNGNVKGLPDVNQKGAAGSPVKTDKGTASSTALSVESLPDNKDEQTDVYNSSPKDSSPEKRPLITELN